MISTDDTNIMLTSHCLCKANTFTFKILKSELPLSASVCHCTSCRHVTGSLYSTFVRLPEPRANIDTSKLKVHYFTHNLNILFCPTCSTPMFWEKLDQPGNSLGAFTGTLANGEVTPIKFTEHIFVGDTTDGGASVWLKHLNADGSTCPRFKLGAGDTENVLPKNWPPADELTGYEKRTDKSISISCKCKGVHFDLQQGDYSDTKKELLPRNVDPVTHKLSTIFCGCDSCRLQGGVDMWFWVCLEMKHLSSIQKAESFPKSSHELKSFVDQQDPIIGSLAYYAS